MADDSEVQQSLVTEGPAPSYGVAPTIVAEGQAPPRAIDLSDKLTLINEALILTGNNQASPGDGSDDWTVASTAFDKWARTLLYNFDFRFASMLATLNRVGDSPFPGFADVYDKPADCLYMRAACRADEAQLIYPPVGFGMPSQDTRLPDMNYRLINDQIHTVADEGVLCLYTPFPTGAQPWSVGFRDALRLFVEADCLRGLNEDFGEADKREGRAQKAAEFASSRDQDQEPRRIMFRSGVLERRRTRGFGGWGR